VVVLLLPNGVASFGSVSKSIRSKVTSLWPSKVTSRDVAPAETNEALA
jgi:hypothetical protein